MNIIKNPIVIGLLAIGGLLGYVFYQSSQINTLERQVQVKDQNIQALSDELSTYVTETQRLVAEKLAFQGVVPQMRDSIESLESEIGDLRSYINTEMVMDFPTIDMPATVEELPDTMIYRTEHDDEYVNIQVKTTIKTNFEHVSTTLENLRINVSVHTGFRENDEEYLVTYAVTSNPYVEFTELEGAVLDPAVYVEQPERTFKRKHTFAIGVGLGIIGTYLLMR